MIMLVFKVFGFHKHFLNASHLKIRGFSFPLTGQFGIWRVNTTPVKNKSEFTIQINYLCFSLFSFLLL